jgi:hypothetical protein
VAANFLIGIKMMISSLPASRYYSPTAVEAQGEMGRVRISVSRSGQVCFSDVIEVALLYIQFFHFWYLTQILVARTPKLQRLEYYQVDMPEFVKQWSGLMRHC